MRLPKYRKQKSTGRALVEIDGRRIYLGKHGEPESRERYRQIINDLLKGQRPQPHALRVEDLILEYWTDRVQSQPGPDGRHVGYYTKGGKPTSEQSCIKSALGFLRTAHGQTLAREFNAAMLESVRDRMIEAGLSRGTINSYVDRIRRMFRWGSSKGRVSGDVWHTLRSLEALRKNRSKAREREAVEQVPDVVIEQTMHFLSPVLQAMVRFQRLTGCRPGEVRTMRPCDIERPLDAPAEGEQPATIPITPRVGPTVGAELQEWCYRPADHKTEHHDIERLVFIGPKAQAVLRPFLDRPAEAFCFDPRESADWERDGAQPPPEPGDQLCLPFDPAPEIAAGERPRKIVRRGARMDHYSKDRYLKAIQEACDQANRQAHAERPEVPAEKRLVPRWTPNQVRHTLATELRKRYGLDAAETVLGHKHAKTTEHYAERDFARAAKIMREVG